MFSRNRANYWVKKDSSGSALILTMLIMAGMMIVALSNSYIVLLGIKASGTQAKSTKAYYVAEAGVERLLWELRKNKMSYSMPDTNMYIISSYNYYGCTVDPETGDMGCSPDAIILNYYGADYYLYFTGFPTLSFQSIGSYQDAKRSVEIKI